MKIFSWFVLSVNIQDGHRNNVKKIQDPSKQKSILHKNVHIWIILIKNIFKNFGTQQNALDLHDEGGDGVQVVEEAGAAVGVSPHLHMVH